MGRSLAGSEVVDEVGTVAVGEVNLLNEVTSAAVLRAARSSPSAGVEFRSTFQLLTLGAGALRVLLAAENPVEAGGEYLESRNPSPAALHLIQIIGDKPASRPVPTAGRRLT